MLRVKRETWVQRTPAASQWTQREQTRWMFFFGPVARSDTGHSWLPHPDKRPSRNVGKRPLEPPGHIPRNRLHRTWPTCLPRGGMGIAFEWPTKRPEAPRIGAGGFSRQTDPASTGPRKLLCLLYDQAPQPERFRLQMQKGQGRSQ